MAARRLTCNAVRGGLEKRGQSLHQHREHPQDGGGDAARELAVRRLCSRKRAHRNGGEQPLQIQESRLDSSGSFVGWDRPGSRALVRPANWIGAAAFFLNSVRPHLVTDGLPNFEQCAL